jgi:hypothetical protein
MLSATIVCAFLGLAISAAGIHGLRYMQSRVFGGWNRVRVIRNLTGRYRVLILEENAPVWPLVLYRVCFPLGIVVAFAAILWVK